MQFFGTVPPGLDLSGQFLCPALGVAEDDSELWIPEIDHPAEHVKFLAVLDFYIGLLGLRDGQLGVLDPDKFRLVLEPFRDVDDRLRHRSREEQGLPALRDFL